MPLFSPLLTSYILQVLRLSRPKLLPPKLLVDEQEDFNFKNDPPVMLSLPLSFGNLYVGETFRCVLSIDSESDDAESPISVTIAVSIGTPNREHPIAIIHPSQPDSTALLGPRENKQYIVEFETHEPGIHVISAVVTYSPKPANNDDDNQQPPPPPVSFTKNYRFTAEQGLYVRTKISPIGPDSCALEAQIENITDSTMTLETAEFMPPLGWISQNLNFDEPLASASLDPPPPTTSTAATTGVPRNKLDYAPSLMPKEIWQFGFIVSHDPDFTDTRQAVGMGKFSVSWRREYLGEKGWLMTGHLKRSPGMQ